MLSILKPYLSNNSNIIILTERDKTRLIEEMNQSHFFCYAKLMSVQDVSLRFSNEYYLYCEERFGLSPLISNAFRTELNFIDLDQKYQSKKLQDLQNYYQSLHNDSIIQQPNPLLFFGKKVFAVDLIERIPFLDLQGISYETITVMNQENFRPRLITVNNDVEMIHQAMEEVCSLLFEGVSPEHIYLLNAKSSDLFEIKKYLFDANIPFAIHSRQRIDMFPLYLSFIHDLKQLSYETAVHNLLERECSVQEVQIRSAILQILAFYDEEKYLSHPTCFFYELQKLTISSANLTNALTILLDDTTSLNSEDYGIVLHFNEGLYPKVKIDDDYIRDTEKEELGMRTTSFCNQTRHKEASYFLSSSSNIQVIHYKNDLTTTYQLPELGLEFVKDSMKESSLYTIYPTMEDYYQLYLGNKIDKELYHPKFQGIHSSTLDLLLAKNIHLSQTSLNVFFECPFHYLLTYLLKFDSFETTFYLYYGNVIHKLIEQYTKKTPTDYHQLLLDYQKDFPEEEIYKFSLYMPILEQRLQDLEAVMPEISFDETFSASESEVSLGYHHELDTRFIMIGKIDQVYLYTDKDQTYAIIVDYKTGNTSFDYEQITSLKQIQLLMYYYLYLHEKRQDGHEVGAMYYQQVHLKRQKRIDEGYKLSDYAYDGITIESSVAEQIVTHAKVRGIKVKNDGTFSETKRLFSKEDMRNIIQQLDQKITDTILQIKNGQFDITPYPVTPGTKKSPSCEYCPYKNICYLESSVQSVFSVDDEEEGDYSGIYESAE